MDPTERCNYDEFQAKYQPNEIHEKINHTFDENVASSNANSGAKKEDIPSVPPSTKNKDV